MKNMLKKKITSGVVLEFASTLYGYDEIVTGTLTVGNGKGRKRTVIEFVWNKQLDTYPMVKNRKWDKQEVKQIASMVNFYSNLRTVVKE